MAVHKGALNRITINLLESHSSVLEYRKTKIDNFSNYHIVAGENNATEFLVSVPETMQDYVYSVEMVNSQGYGVPSKILTEDMTFTLPKGMCVAGYGQISISATKGETKVVWLPIKVKIWDTISKWQDEIDPKKTYVTQTELDARTQELENQIAQAGKVQSVNGKTGDVVLNAEDIDLFPIPTSDIQFKF